MGTVSAYIALTHRGSVCESENRRAYSDTQTKEHTLTHTPTDPHTPESSVCVYLCFSFLPAVCIASSPLFNVFHSPPNPLLFLKLLILFLSFLPTHRHTPSASVSWSSGGKSLPTFHIWPTLFLSLPWSLALFSSTLNYLSIHIPINALLLVSPFFVLFLIFLSLSLSLYLSLSRENGNF